MRGVIYARYSSIGQREESVEGQLRECKAFAERKGITIVGSYIRYRGQNPTNVTATDHFNRRKDCFLDKPLQGR